MRMLTEDFSIKRMLKNKHGSYVIGEYIKKYKEDNEYYKKLHLNQMEFFFDLRACKLRIVRSSRAECSVCLIPRKVIDIFNHHTQENRIGGMLSFNYLNDQQCVKIEQNTFRINYHHDP